MINPEVIYKKGSENGHGSLIRLLRGRVKLSLEKLAAKVGSTRSKLETIEQKTWRQISLGDIEILSPVFNMRPDELFFYLFVSSTNGAFSRTHQTKPFFRIELENGVKISSWMPQNSSCFIGQIQIPPKTSLSKDLVPRANLIFYRIEKKGELLVSLLPKECVLKEGECLTLNGPVPYEIYNPTLYQVEVTLVTLPSFLEKGRWNHGANGNGLKSLPGEKDNGKHE